MSLQGIDAVVFGVADMAEAKRFLDDWGVAAVSNTADKLVYRTRDRLRRTRSSPAIPCAK